MDTVEALDRFYSGEIAIVSKFISEENFLPRLISEFESNDSKLNHESHLKASLFSNVLLMEDDPIPVIALTNDLLKSLSVCQNKKENTMFLLAMRRKLLTYSLSSRHDREPFYRISALILDACVQNEVSFESAERILISNG